MNDMIDQFEEQLGSYKKLKKCVERQQDFLMNLEDDKFQKEAYSMESLMNEIKSRERTIQKKLGENKADEKIKRLLNQVKLAAADIQKINESNGVLLKNRMDFIRFNINVATQATAGAAYQPNAEDTAGSTRKIKMFDQSI
ncbi:flagellar export chaperone FlgN [Pectinatus haikarae]|uniref:flagellar export chaperone FlgN n=1 Tax=Pectinatus haikarae TaxID=349096 RepID=UPI0018C74284|nr:flagellar export chaperone FlgN [Pectinatus haikarae]